MELPSGTVTFFLTDIEGSTRLWEEHPGEMAEALARHDALVAGAVEAHDGTVLKARGEGDAVFGVYADPARAVAAALALQRALGAEPWPEQVPIRVRVAIHTGDAELRDGDYFGPAVNRAARLRAVAHGGQIVLSGGTAELTRTSLPDGASLADLGSHRLKDLARPERIFQLAHPALPSDFPPLRSLEAASHNLPTQLTSFIGREEEIAEVSKLLAHSRLVTIVGAGGAGKTRLSLQVAAEALDSLPDGAWFCELAPVADPGLVAGTVLRALGLREEPGRDVLDTLSGACGSKNALIVLDNCEHVVAAAATVADRMLRDGENMRILATSREPLGVPGEVVWRIPSLPAPDPGAGLAPEALLEFESVRLFRERAALARSGFTLSAENAPAVAEICARLDGIPLAIELAAARVSSLSPAQIAERLDDRFRLLTGGSRTLLPRQQTLRALVDWSHDLLDDAERALLRRAAVFAGGFTLDAAEQVCGTDPISPGDVLDLVGRLVDKSLVVTGEEAEPRYRMLETIRAYGLERLAESGEQEMARDRHAVWVIGLARQAEPALSGHGQKAMLDRLDAEHENVRAALSRARDSGDGTMIRRIAGDLWRFWWIRGYLSEGRRWCETALAAGGLSEEGRGRMLGTAAVFASNLGDLEGAEGLAAQAVEIRRALGHPGPLAAALNVLADVIRLRGAFDRARVPIDEALRMARAHDDPAVLAACLNTAGIVVYGLGDLERARALFTETVEVRRRMGDVQGYASALGNLGIIVRKLGDDEAARVLYEDALATQREIGHKQSIAISLINLGNLALARDDTAEARARYRESLSLALELETPSMAVLSITGIGASLFIEGDVDRAGRLMAAARALVRDIEDKLTLEGPFDVAAALSKLEELGADGPRRLIAEGAAMTLEEAARLALEP